MSLDRARAGHDQASEQGLIPVQIGPGQAGQARARQGSRSNLPHPPPLPRRPGSPAPRHHMLQGRQGTVRQGTVDNKRAPSVAPRDLDASRLLPGHGGRAATYLPGRALLQTAVGQILQVWVSFHVNSFIHRQRRQRDILHLCECRGPKKRPSKHSNTHTHTHTQPTRLATTRRPHHTSLTLFFFFQSPSLVWPPSPNPSGNTEVAAKPHPIACGACTGFGLTRRQHWTACCLVLVPDPVTKSHERGYSTTSRLTSAQPRSKRSYRPGNFILAFWPRHWEHFGRFLLHIYLLERRDSHLAIDQNPPSRREAAGCTQAACTYPWLLKSPRVFAQKKRYSGGVFPGRRPGVFCWCSNDIPDGGPQAPFAIRLEHQQQLVKPVSPPSVRLTLSHLPSRLTRFWVLAFWHPWHDYGGPPHNPGRAGRGCMHPNHGHLDHPHHPFSSAS